MNLTIYDILNLTNGTLVSGDIDLQINNVSIDSRTINTGDLFVALEGENFDGHDFILEAVSGGAVGVVAEEKKLSKCSTVDSALVSVQSTLKAFSEIARGHRMQYDIPLIAVTGSNGKTTTKDMLAAILSQKYQVLKSKENYNNEIGLPYTLLKIQEETKVAVVEMAMRGIGQIKELCETAMPQIGILTNIGPAHFELLGSLRRIALAKGELLKELPADGLAVINWEDEWCKNISSLAKCRIIKYGFNKECDVRAENIYSEGLRIHYDLCYKKEREQVSLPVTGKHNVLNSLAAAAASVYLGFGLNEISSGLSSFQLSAMRLEFINAQKGSIVINDAYNANPVSTKASLEILQDVPGSRKIAVLGDMLELGELTEQGHLEVGKDAAEKGVDYLITVGRLSKDISRGAILAGMTENKIFHFFDLDTAAEKTLELLANNAVVLIKGSRSMKMENIARKLV